MGSTLYECTVYANVSMSLYNNHTHCIVVYTYNTYMSVHSVRTILHEHTHTDVVSAFRFVLVNLCLIMRRNCAEETIKKKIAVAYLHYTGIVST